ncbi:MAG: ketoacyl-ACP synthase III [Lentimicrobiaceae bacterium]|nr:ketoacyl-ACP synthase III [Lentimicrobiaceae bacterium]
MNRNIKAVITGVSGYLPDYILTNEELSRMVDTSDEWIMTRIGIKERRLLKQHGLGSSYMAEHAVNDLLKKTNTNPEDVDMVVCATVTPDMLFPSNASIVSDKCGIKNAFSFDIEAACSSFLYSLSVAQKFIESGTHKKVIVIGADKMSSIIDYTDRATCPIFGDAAGAVLLEPTTEDVGIIDSYLRSDGVGRHHLYMKAGGSAYPPTIETVTAREHYVIQEGQVVFKWAVSKMVEATEEVLKKNNLTINDIDWLVPHQANLRIIHSVAHHLKLSPDKVMINIHRYGNTTSGTLPLCLYDYEKQLKKGDKIILVTFGGGFTWGATYLKWGYDGDNK